MNLIDLRELLASNCPIQHAPYEVLFKSVVTLISCVLSIILGEIRLDD